MTKYKLIVMSEPAKGQEAQYNAWYNDRHLQDVVAVPGFGGAQRFKLQEVAGGEFKQRYIAIYDIEAEDYAAALKELMNRAGTSAMPIDASLDDDSIAFGVFEACSPRVMPPDRDA
jgi:hypothetical protein